MQNSKVPVGLVLSTTYSPNGVKQSPVTLPDGTVIDENGPVVIIGPNGSGKTRRSRSIVSPFAEVEVVNALRSTRISPQLQAMTMQDAKNTYLQQRQSVKLQPAEIATDFDFMLTSLIGEGSDSDREFVRRSRAGDHPDLPFPTTLEKIEAIWAEVFPGREVRFTDFKPYVLNSVAVGDEPTQYSAHGMSDGEKAALYLAGRVLTVNLGAVILIDEPETHFHSLLAVRFWDMMEEARPDVRFMYATHDMTFAVSRNAVVQLLANPVSGLKKIKLAGGADDLAATLLGTASLSFFADKVIFCEGQTESLDAKLYRAWFNENETVVQPVGSCEMVMRSVAALASSDLVQNLTVYGIIDRDFHSDDRLATLPMNVLPLGVHEVETLFALPEVVAAVATHMSKSFDVADYRNKIIEKYTESDRQAVVIERWKGRIERSLTTVVSQVTSKNESLATITSSIPDIFEQSKWPFSPTDILKEEISRVEEIATAANQELDGILTVMPGKQLNSLGPASVQMKPSAYLELIIKAIGGTDPVLEQLGVALRSAIAGYMPIFT